MSQTTTLVNGNVSHSAFVDHLASYPVVSSSIATYKSYPLGAQTIDLLADTYRRFITPFVTHPFAQQKIKPRLSPYLSKADNFGDQSLNAIDSRFPIVKEDAKEIQSQFWGLVSRPFAVADEGKKHIFETYNKEYQKMGGDGYVAGVKALLSTSLLTTSESLSFVASWAGQKQAHVKAKADEKLKELN